MKLSIPGSPRDRAPAEPATDAQLLELLNTYFPAKDAGPDFFVLLRDVLPPAALETVPMNHERLEWAARAIFFKVLEDGATMFHFIQRRSTLDRTPTRWDYSLLEHLGKIGALLGIAITDYTIFASDGSVYSFFDAGKIPRIEVPNPF